MVSFTSLRHLCSQSIKNFFGYLIKKTQVLFESTMVWKYKYYLQLSRLSHLRLLKRHLGILSKEKVLNQGIKHYIIRIVIILADFPTPTVLPLPKK